MLRADTVLRVFPGGHQCEVEVPTWVGLDGLTYGEEPDTWNSMFDPAYEDRQVGHGSVAGFVVTVRPGVFS